ncbi:MAG: hypothetical protein FJ319_00060 [SAR202 cluster bacterium]|nr:hypothetical protein [SAR202 cluster bacterium]
MPNFMDHHQMRAQMPAELAGQIKSNLQAGKKDQFGVKPINVLMGEGEGWCLTDAPNAQAVIDSHGAMGIKVAKAEVKQITPVVAFK